jgi:hypothetical protein
MTDLKLEDLYYVCVYSKYTDSFSDFDYEELYLGLNNAIKAAESSIDGDEYTILIRSAMICDDGSFGHNGLFTDPPFVLRYQPTCEVLELPNGNFADVYEVTDKYGNVERRTFNN